MDLYFTEETVITSSQIGDAIHVCLISDLSEEVPVVLLPLKIKSVLVSKRPSQKLDMERSDS
jgi:hypothetical protein